MIGVRGQYIMKVNFGGREDFLAEEDLRAFLLIEEAGNVLPTFEMEFIVHDPSILRLINEGNVIEVALGKIDLELMNVRLVILHKFIIETGQSQYHIRVVGMANSLGYLTDHKVRAFSNTSGVAVIKQVVASHFRPLFGISVSNDSQTWIQHSISDKEFVSKVWMHSDCMGSFPMVGISADGEFVLKDMKGASTDVGSRWKLRYEQASDNDEIQINASGPLESETGFVNSWVGYERTKKLMNLDSGASSEAVAVALNFLAVSNKLDRNAGAGRRSAEHGVLNENVHSNYWKSYVSNLTNLALYGSVKIDVTFSSRFEKIRVLDTAMVLYPEIRAKESAEYQSGLYVITKVVRSYFQKSFQTLISLNREASNRLVGDLQ